MWKVYVLLLCLVSFNAAKSASISMVSHDRDILLLKVFPLLSSNEKVVRVWGGPDPCQWEGITCDHEGYATHVSLALKGVYGPSTVLEYMGELTRLASLDVSFNYLEGKDPLVRHG
jgi:hypothetical protein